MQQDDQVKRLATLVPFVLTACLSVLGGCSSVRVAYGVEGAGNTNGSGNLNAVAQGVPGDCTQTDSSITCCLKKNPGQYARCGATPPNKGTPKPLPLLPPSALTDKQRTRRKEFCQEYYERCIAAGGEYIEGFTYGKTQCAACYDECYKAGQWPAEFNGEPCPGGLQ
jgi:hypothetical protein